MRHFQRHSKKCQSERWTKQRRAGIICAIAYSGEKWQDQWLGSRLIAVGKASTWLDFSLDSKAIVTANLYAGAQPGGFLFGLPSSDQPAPDILSTKHPEQIGTTSDPLIGKKAGGVIVFGGGLALYDGAGLIGDLGVSGDTSCANHNVAWRVWYDLALDHVRSGHVNSYLAPGLALFERRDARRRAHSLIAATSGSTPRIAITRFRL